MDITPAVKLTGDDIFYIAIGTRESALLTKLV